MPRIGDHTTFGSAYLSCIYVMREHRMSTRGSISVPAKLPAAAQEPRTVPAPKGGPAQWAPHAPQAAPLPPPERPGAWADQQ
jgi:hypothetical protein